MDNLLRELLSAVNTESGYHIEKQKIYNICNRHIYTKNTQTSENNTHESHDIIAVSSNTNLDNEDVEELLMIDPEILDVCGYQLDIDILNDCIKSAYPNQNIMSLMNLANNNDPNQASITDNADIVNKIASAAYRIACVKDTIDLSTDFHFNVIIHHKTHMLCREQSFCTELILHNGSVAFNNNKILFTDSKKNCFEVCFKTFVFNNGNEIGKRFYNSNYAVYMISDKRIAISMQTSNNAPLGYFYIVIAFVAKDGNIVALSRSREKKLYKHAGLPGYITRDTKINQIEKRNNICTIFKNFGMHTIGDVIDNILCDMNISDNAVYIEIKKMMIENSIDSSCSKKIIEVAKNVKQLYRHIHGDIN